MAVFGCSDEYSMEAAIVYPVPDSFLALLAEYEADRHTDRAHSPLQFQSG